METRAGMTGTICDGVFFTEGDGTAFRMTGKQISVKIDRQNANLVTVKQELARKVRGVGGDALVGFVYGQRKTLFGWDGVAWHGSGFAASIGTEVRLRK